VGTSTQIDIDLVPDLMELDEVIVVGYGTQKRSDITGAVAKMEGEGLTERPITRVDQALVGQMAGVRIKQTSGMPGKGMKIQVRGSGSISGNTEPLYVIDGFPLEVSQQTSSGGFEAGNPLDNLNPNDIESIQVLKDASATAIYGSRGSNGVVLIQTKSGKAGKPNISFNAYTGFNEPVRHCDMLNAEEWIERATEIINYNYLSDDPGDQNRQVTDDYDTRVANIGSFNRSQILDPRWAMEGHPGLTLIDWQDEIFRKGKVQNYQLSASGGNENAKYYISGDYLDQEGFIVGVNYKRYAARTNVELKRERLKFGLNLAPSYSVSQDPGAEGKDQQMHIATGMVPISEDTVGLEVNTGDYPSYTWGNSRNSPYMVLKNTTGETKLFRTLATVYSELEILKDLSFKTTLNLDYTDSKYKYYRPAFVSGSITNRTASGKFSGYTRKTFVNENYFNYSKTIGNHSVSAVAGMSYHQNAYESFRIQGAGGFGSDYITTLNDINDINASKTDTRESKNVLLSYYGRLNYTFSEKYLLSAIIRRDGSSRFGKDTKWGLFPSFSAGWRISKESFMQDITVINNLKLRGSWGVSGNESFSSSANKGNYDHISLLQSSNYTFGNQSVVGYSSSLLANSALSWEESRTINIGLDYGILNNRIQGAFDYYVKTNTDLLLEIDVPAATGFENAVTNIGEVKNKGWEFELTTFNLTGEFNWSTSINLSHNENEVVHLGPDDSPIYGGSYDIPHNILKVGYPMYSINVVQQDGILSQADIDNGAALYGNQVEGDPKYVDQLTVDTDGDGVPDEADGVITPDDRVIVGHPDPDIIWSINNTFSFKGFDVSVLLQGQRGGHLYSTFGRAIDRTGMGWIDGAIGLHRDRWRSPEDPGAGQKGKAYSSFGRIKNTDWMYSNDYWRVRNITIGYDLGRIIKIEQIKGARIYATAENFFGADKYYGGYNPEAVNTKGDDYGGAPLPKSLIFGVNLKF
jgi:TonB-linked SusC/RagA family outer membrane protein